MPIKALLGQKTADRNERTVVFQIVREYGGRTKEIIRIAGLDPVQFRKSVQAKKEVLRKYIITPDTVHIGKRLSHKECKIVAASFAKDVSSNTYCNILYEELAIVTQQAI